MQLTGLARTSVVEALNKAQARGVLVKEKDGGVTIWSINFVEPVEQKKEEESEDEIGLEGFVVGKTYQTGSVTLPPSIKETIKEKNDAPKTYPLESVYRDLGIRNLVVAFSAYFGLKTPLNYTSGRSGAKAWIQDAKEFISACEGKDPVAVMKACYDHWDREGRYFNVYTPRSVISLIPKILGKDIQNSNRTAWGEVDKREKRIKTW
jgi:hypothetical protein